MYVSSGNGGSEWNKVVFFGESQVLSLLSHCPEHVIFTDTLEMHDYIWVLLPCVLLMEICWLVTELNMHAQDSIFVIAHQIKNLISFIYKLYKKSNNLQSTLQV